MLQVGESTPRVPLVNARWTKEVEPKLEPQLSLTPNSSTKTPQARVRWEPTRSTPNPAIRNSWFAANGWTSSTSRASETCAVILWPESKSTPRETTPPKRLMMKRTRIRTDTMTLCCWTRPASRFPLIRTRVGVYCFGGYCRRKDFCGSNSGIVV